MHVPLTCQLTRLDKFSTVRRYSVRVGGPYLQREKDRPLSTCIFDEQAGLSWT